MSRDTWEMNGPRNRVKGLTFEKTVEWACRRQSIKFIRMPMGARPVRGRGGRPQLIAIKTFLDYILIKDGKSIFLDCKSFEGDSLSYSMLTLHQIHELKDIQNYGAKAGYLVHHRKSDQVCFYLADKLCDLGPRESISPAAAAFILGSGELFDLSVLFS